MRTIYKYEIGPAVKLLMPRLAQILCVQVQNGVPHIWAIVDTDDDMDDVREIFCAGTGHPLPPNCLKENYIGTFQLRDQRLVFHVFDVT